MSRKDRCRKQLCESQVLSLHHEDCLKVVCQMQQQKEEVHIRARSYKDNKQTSIPTSSDAGTSASSCFCLGATKKDLALPNIAFFQLWNANT